MIDPNRTWNDMLVAYSIKDWATATEHAIAMLDYLNENNFPPEIITVSTNGHFTAQLDYAWNLAMAEAGCNVVITRGEQEVML